MATPTNDPKPKPRKKVTAPMLQEMKREGRPISALTAYDATLARVLDAAGLDMILVGDSAGMVVGGHPDTLSITLDEMVFLAKSVRRGVKKALLIGDIPFGPLQMGTEACLEAGVRLMKEARVEGVKVEGAGPALEPIARMTQLGIPVVGHLGLTPQSVNEFGGYGLRGGSSDEAERIRNDAVALQNAGVFALVLEKIPAPLAREITSTLSIPTIGIGSGNGCDGQILVTHDLLGLGPKFRFVRRYLEGDELIGDAVRRYIDDVRGHEFPNSDESYS